MNQTKLESLLETCLNIAIGFIISLLLWIYLVAPLWGLEMSMFDNLGITGIFTVSAVARGYVMRRFFNAGIHKAIHKAIHNWVKNQADQEIT